MIVMSVCGSHLVLCMYVARPGSTRKASGVSVCLPMSWNGAETTSSRYGVSKTCVHFTCNVSVMLSVITFCMCTNKMPSSGGRKVQRCLFVITKLFAVTTLAQLGCVTVEGGRISEGPGRTFAQSQHRNSTACESESARHYNEPEWNYSQGDVTSVCSTCWPVTTCCWAAFALIKKKYIYQTDCCLAGLCSVCRIDEWNVPGIEYRVSDWLLSDGWAWHDQLTATLGWMWLHMEMYRGVG